MTAYSPDVLDQRDARLIASVLPALEWFTERYFRFHYDGLENIPRGAVMFAGNHNGGIMGPDLFCTLPMLWRALGPASPLYALAHDFPMRQLTRLGWLLQKFGALSANGANATKVLTSGGQILVYPGGDIDAYRPFSRRNEVLILPRTGFVKIAQATGAPIVPLVAHGAHRSAYIAWEGKRIARFLRMPQWARLQRFPIALALPWGVAAGPWLPYLPLPLRVQLRVLAPVHVGKDENPAQVAEEIQRRMQRALTEMSR